jgi:hypothetical protein
MIAALQALYFATSGNLAKDPNRVTSERCVDGKQEIEIDGAMTDGRALRGKNLTRQITFPLYVDRQTPCALLFILGAS